jgi:thiol-disulfide isomerase/thioredoxin
VRRRNWLRTAFAGVAACLLLAATPLAAEDDSPVDFEMALLGGGKVVLSDLRGQWVVLNYWATWCGPCRKEIPDLSAMHDRNHHITVLGLAFEETSEEEFYAFLEDYPASFPILLVDVMNPPAPFGAPKVLPTTILLNPDGVPVETWVGPVTSGQIEGFISAY